LQHKLDEKRPKLGYFVPAFYEYYVSYYIFTELAGVGYRGHQNNQQLFGAATMLCVYSMVRLAAGGGQKHQCLIPNFKDK
jgi:hypothetical protein